MRKTRLLIAFTALPLAFPLGAETPPFDRPGTGFSPVTLPARTFAWEQGLPDMVRQKSGGVTQILYSADALMRAGLSDKLELQLSHAPYNYLRTGGRGPAREVEGASGTGISLKVALPAPNETLSWALLGGSTLDTGDAPFSPEDTIYSLGSSLQWQLRNDRSLSLYVNVDRIGGESAITISPSYSLAINACSGAYLELAVTRFERRDRALAGGGLTWMVVDNVQLDLYANFGLNSAANDLQAGFGFSVFIE
ncbi:transporter [Microbulbifer magnicolonia]|uniref:transporter n=1 Tax=Microbulbifer magnicolonia TaxID=3109744 RepID=UPI002B4118B2|nr:transporter [Microbulbifer sp. GG15]